MGQKTNPIAFRLVTTQKHLSQWYANKNAYPKLIEEDFFVREKIKKTFDEILTISRIEITRVTQAEKENEHINVQISALYPRSKEILKKINKFFNDETGEKSPNVFSNVKGSLKKFTGLLLKRTIRNLVREFQIYTKKEYFITLKFIKNRFEDSILIAKYIAEQLEKRTPFRRAIKQTIKKVEKSEIKGIKIQLSGRLNGVEIARSEWKREGKVPLHTLRAKIDYTHQFAETIYGLIGIKVWLFQGE